MSVLLMTQQTYLVDSESCRALQIRNGLRAEQAGGLNIIVGTYFRNTHNK